MSKEVTETLKILKEQKMKEKKKILKAKQLVKANRIVERSCQDSSVYKENIIKSPKIDNNSIEAFLETVASNPNTKRRRSRKQLQFETYDIATL